jgi:hypothetical protein
MENSAPTARAGFALACALLALALPWPDRLPEVCLQPRFRAPGEVVCDASAGPGQPRFAGPARRLFGLPIDPNCADLVTLETLPGIGPARARAIADERRRRPFASLADLERVRGLGPARVGALTPWVAIDPGLAPCDAPSVKSNACRSSCGSAGIGRPP